MELDRIERVDLESDDPDRPPELLDFLGALVERCERELGPRAPCRGLPPPRTRPSRPLKIPLPRGGEGQGKGGAGALQRPRAALARISLAAGAGADLPALDDDARLRVEPDRVLAGRVEVAEKGSPAREREERHRRGDADVHTDYARLDVAPEVRRRGPLA